MTSASFHLAGKELVRIEQLMISVNGPSITSRQSLSTRAVTLSGPGDLSIGSDLTTRRTSSHDTDFRLKRPGVLELGLDPIAGVWLLCCSFPSGFAMLQRRFGQLSRKTG